MTTTKEIARKKELYDEFCNNYNNYKITTTKEVGRTGNQVIRNIAVSLIAEKNDLYVDYCNKQLIMNELGIKLFCGKQIHNNTILLTDDNYISVYNSDNLKSNLYPVYSFFQTKEIMKLIYDYLHSHDIYMNIIEKNPFKNRYNNNNDLLIHVRLTDGEKYNPGINYYLNTIKKLKSFDNIYIVSDDIHNKLIQNIIEVYPFAVIKDYNVLDTIQFASTCRTIILSHGSFSATIGYLAFYSTIHYPKYELDKIWYGDMCSVDGWIKHDDF